MCRAASHRAHQSTQQLAPRLAVQAFDAAFHHFQRPRSDSLRARVCPRNGMLMGVVGHVVKRLLTRSLAIALGLGATLTVAWRATADDDQTTSHFSWFLGWPQDLYALDRVDRFVEPGQRFQCADAHLVTYRGTHIPYRGGARVHAAFVPRLERFEQLVNQLAVEHYGRTPRRILHRGAYNCRVARGRRARLSEHALGNALDLQGFEFPLLRTARGEVAPAGMPRHMRRGFQIGVKEHWSGRRARERYHALFLHRLADALRERPDIFRGIVGPPRPRHGDHLHLDAAPWRYAMYGYEPLQ